MTGLLELGAAIERTLLANGFVVRRELTVAKTRFDVVAEDNTRLVFVALRASNSGWLDDFYDRQAALATGISSLRLGPKWRDVYLLEITTDPIDDEREFEIAEEIQSNTTVARKIVVDASGVDSTSESDMASLLAPVLAGPEVRRTEKAMDILGLLQDRLVNAGFSRRMVRRLIEDFAKDGHDCIEIVVEESQ